MNLDYLYQRHQISVFMADNASCEEARQAHRGLADGYAMRILEARLLANRAGSARCNG